MDLEKLKQDIEAYKQSEQEASGIIAELKAENEKLIEGLGIANKYVNKYHQILQEIKAIAKGIRGYLKVPTPRDVRYEMDRILDLITKTEEE